MSNQQVTPGTTVSLATNAVLTVPAHAFEVYSPAGSLIAFSGSAGGWNAVPLGTASDNIYPTIQLTVPSGTASGVGYTVRVANGGGRGTAVFDIPAPAPPAVPTLAATPELPDNVSTILLTGN